MQLNGQPASVNEEEMFILSQEACRSIPVSTSIRDEDNLLYALSLYGPDPWASCRTGNWKWLSSTSPVLLHSYYRRFLSVQIGETLAASNNTACAEIAGSTLSELCPRVSR